jgi:hypothetical protein
MNSKRVALQYLTKLALDFPHRIKLVKEHGDIVENLEHLERRYNIDKISDPAYAQEIKKEIKEAQDRVKEILEELSF